MIFIAYSNSVPGCHATKIINLKISKMTRFTRTRIF